MGGENEIRNIRIQQRVSREGRLLGQHVDSGAAQAPVPQGAGEGRRVHESAAGGVDQHRIIRHQVQLPGTNKATGLGREGAMQADHIRSGQEFIHGDPVRAVVFAARAAGDPDAHPERLAGAGHRASQLAQADNAEGSSVQLTYRKVQETELGAAAPCSVRHQPLISLEPPGEAQEEREHVLGHRSRAVCRDVADPDAAAGGDFEIDVVGASGREAHEFQLLCAFQDAGIENQFVGDHDTGVRDPPGQVFGVRDRPGRQLEGQGFQGGEIQVPPAHRREIREHRSAAHELAPRTGTSAENHPPHNRLQFPPMLSFLRGPLLGVITIGLMVLNVVLIAIPLLTVALLKVLPIPPLRRWLSRVLTKIAELWVDINAFIFRVTQDFEWKIEGTDGLDYGSHYLVMSNHRSWVDVLVLQWVFRRKVPFLKFFIKKELFWVPFLGQAWWALDMPFMQRHSREYLKAHPEAKGQDLEATRIACEKFRDIPTSVMNFVEGTRFTEAKHAAQESPFQHLLRPRAGGVSFVVSAMDGMLDSLLDVTLAYEPDSLNFWQFCCGRMKRISVRVRQREVPVWAAGDYQSDPAFRARFQDWLNELWTTKDADYAALTDQAGA